MPNIQFSTPAITGKTTKWESGQEITFQVEITGANATTSTASIASDAFAQTPVFATFTPSKSTKTRTVKVTAIVKADPGVHNVNLVAALGGTVTGNIATTFEVVHRVTVNFDQLLIGKDVSPPYEAGDRVELRLTAKGPNTSPASIEIHCDAFTLNPVRVDIPATGRIGATKTRTITAPPVLLKGAGRTYNVELRNNSNCAIGVGTTTLDLVDPVSVSFATPPFKDGLDDLKPEQSVKLCLKIDRAPKADLDVTIRCPGFGKGGIGNKSLNPFSFKIKKKTDPLKPLEESINLAKEDGKYKAEIAFPKSYIIGTPGDFDFDIGLKRVEAWLPEHPFENKLYDAVAQNESHAVKIEFSETLKNDVSLTLKCPGFDPPKHEFKVKKGQTSPFVTTQKFLLTGDPGLHRIELIATDTILQNPVDVRKSNATSLFKLPWPPGIPTIEFADPAYATPSNGAKNFAPGETVRFFLQLDRAVPVRCPVVIKSDGFAEVTIGRDTGRFGRVILQKGQLPDDPPVIEVTLREDIDFSSPGAFKMFTASLAVKPEHFNEGAQKTAQYDIRSFPVAFFSAKLPVKPASDDGYDAGTQITFRLELSEPASRGGASAVIKSPLFATSKATPDGELAVEWEEGRTIAMVDARIMTSQIDVVLGGDYEVELLGPLRKCILSEDAAKLKTTVKIRPLPIVTFRNAWITPATGPYRVGQYVTFAFELDRPASAIGAQFSLTSPLFNAPVPCEFVSGEQILKVRVLLDNPSPTGATEDIEIIPLDPLFGCRPSPVPEDMKAALEVLPSPKVKFSADWITPSGITEYAAGTDVQITVELDAPAPEDAYARISSSAFGGKSYIVQFPKGSTSQGAIVQTGKEDHPEKLLKPLLTSRVGRGAIRGLGGGMAIDTPVKPLEKSVTVNLNLGFADRTTKATKVQTIRVTPIRGCGGSDIRDIYVKPNLRRRLDDPVAPCPFSPPPSDPPKHCNLHRLLIQEFHGSTPASRGHDGGGTFEVVASDAAPKMHRGAVVTPMRIQMIAGKAIYTVDDKPFHNTNIKIFADRKDYFCDDLFPHLDRKEGGRPHPHVTVLQKKPYRLEALLAGGASVAAQQRLESVELPEYPGWVAVNPEVGTPTSHIMKWHKIEKQEPTAPNAKLGNPLWQLKLAKRRQGFDKMLTKAVAALIGKQELVFTDDDEALAEATNIGIDTSELIGGISLGTLLQSLMTIWVPRLEQYQVILESCGDPDPAKPTPKIPAPRLVATIEVYPSDEFCLFCNVSPVPAMQFGNDGQYMDINGIKDDPDVNKTTLHDDMPVITNAPDTVGDALQPVTDQNLGPLSGSMLTSPVTGFVSGVTGLGSQAPAENYAADEISGQRNVIGQHGQSHGGGQVHESPEFGGANPEQSSQGFAQLSLKPKFTYLTTGKDGFELRRKDGLATPPRYPAPTPKTRVFHQVYEMDLFGATGATGDLTRDWNIAKIGLVVNGNPKPQFSPATAAIFGLLYVIRHWSDIWRAVQEMVPSWGWGVTFDLGFLEGGLRLRWGWKEYEDWKVFRWWQMEINCNLFRIMIELWAGFRARALFIKFEFVAFIRLTGIINVKASIERTGPSPGDVEGEFQLTDHKNDKKVASWNADLSGSTTAEVGLRMVLINDGFVKATGSIKTGYVLKFKFQEPIEGKLGLTLEGYFLGVSIKFIVQAVGLKKYIQKEKVLIEGDPDGRPRFRRILFPKGAHGQKTPWKVKDQLELIWQKVSAQVARLDEALNDWYKVQLDLVLRRDKEEFERLAATNPRAEWPWTDDPGVSIQLTPNGFAMKTTEDAQWRQQWALCKEALIANRIVTIWDLGDASKTKYKKSPLVGIPKVGRTLHKKIKGKDKVESSNKLALAIVKEAEEAEFGIEKVKQAIATINVKFVSVLEEIDRELERFADEDLKVSEEILERIDEAKSWASWGVHSEKVGYDTRGTVRGIVEDALEDFDIPLLAKLAYQLDRWQVGGETVQPQLFTTVDKTKITDNPSGITVWVGGTQHTVDITGKNHLIGLRNAINAAELGVIASIEPSGKSFYLVLSPERSNMGNLAVTDGPGGPLITGRK